MDYITYCYHKTKLEKVKHLHCKFTLSLLDAGPSKLQDYGKITIMLLKLLISVEICNQKQICITIPFVTVAYIVSLHIIT